MVNYQEGKIYKIVCNITGKIYVGSTCKSRLCQRLSEHVQSYKRFIEGRDVNVRSSEIIANDDYDIILLENCPCDNKDELRQRERYFIELLDCVNKNIPNRTKKEYRQQFKEKEKAKGKEYREKHPEKVKVWKKAYYATHKKQDNERCLKYRETHKEEIKAKQGKVIQCVCGTSHTHQHTARHIRSKKHQGYLASLREE
jgi:hypothetical protein